ncbi:MAG: sigma 54-interacting transcriptional regulator [Chromatiales bacterium]|jgi:PAS domain S-box-containing protein
MNRLENEFNYEQKPGSWDPIGPFQLYFDSHPEPTLVIDPVADQIHEANRAACDLLGYSRDELLALYPSALHPQEMPALIVFTQSVLHNGSGWTSELSCRSKHGEEISVEYHARLAQATPVPLLVISFHNRANLEQQRMDDEANDYVRRGLSEWRRVERLFQEIEAENQLLLKAAGDGIYGVNTEGITTFVNPAACELLGWSADELVGRNMHQLVHHTHADGSHYHDEDCPIYKAFRDGIVHRVEDEVFWRKDGSPLPVEYTSTPIRDRGRLVGAVLIFRDITERKQAENDLRNALDEVQRLKQRLEDENAYLQEEISAEHNYQEIVGVSHAVKQVFRQIELVAHTDATVLINGESGTGKELIARAIHNNSQRAEKPMIRVNCAAIPHELFESEFFGHVKGAFTGATRDRTGRFKLADGGTLFLDEVGEIPIDLQGKLLRVLQEGQFERVGEERTRSVNVRVIAATNRDLKQEIRDKRFREDLYFRLNVYPIECAPLRDRLEDIPLLASHFLQRLSRRMGVRNIRLVQSDVSKLQSYDWPGNVRELENVIERAVISARNGRLNIDLPCVANTETTQQDASAGQTTPTDGILTETQRVQRDREVILKALQSCNGKVFGAGGAAELLGVKPTTLASRMKKLGIEKPKRKSS